MSEPKPVSAEVEEARQTEVALSKLFRNAAGPGLFAENQDEIDPLVNRLVSIVERVVQERDDNEKRWRSAEISARCNGNERDSALQRVEQARQYHETELASVRSERDRAETALKLVCGALTDSGFVVPHRWMDYGTTVEKIVKAKQQAEKMSREAHEQIARYIEVSFGRCSLITGTGYLNGEDVAGNIRRMAIREGKEPGE